MHIFNNSIRIISSYKSGKHTFTAFMSYGETVVISHLLGESIQFLHPRLFLHPVILPLAMLTTFADDHLIRAVKSMKGCVRFKEYYINQGKNANLHTLNSSLIALSALLMETCQFSNDLAQIVILYTSDQLAVRHHQYDQFSTFNGTSVLSYYPGTDSVNIDGTVRTVDFKSITKGISQAYKDVTLIPHANNGLSYYNDI